MKNQKINFKKIKIVFGMDADRDWQFVTIISFIVTLCGIAFSLWVYLNFVYFSDSVSTEVTSSNFLDKSKIQNILEENQKKAAELSRIRNNF